MLGGVVNSSHQFVGQLRFTPASVPAVVGPMIVWQVLHAIAGVHHMVKIERQLSLLHRGIQQILVRLGARAYAELQAAIECLQDLDAEYRVVGRFTDDMRLRLAIAHRDVRRVFAEERLHYDEFTREKKAVLDETGATGAARVVSLLREKPEYLLDVDLFLTASRASVMVHQACLARDLEHAPEAIPLRLASIRKEADALTELVNAVSEVKQLKAHADACVQSLSWLRRNPRWGVAADVAALGADQKESSAEPDDAAEPCLMMWQERAGLIRTVVVDNARFGPTEDRLPGPS